MLFKTLTAQSSASVLVLLAAFTLSPLSAFAQNEIPVFTPANAWSVGATELSSVRGLKDVKLPCVMSNEYDNGYIVRFSGGGNQMLAMAIDFRQDAFQKGRKYNTSVSIGDSYLKQVPASAFTASTLIFSLRNVPDFYNTLKAGKDMSVDIEGNSFKFSLQQLAQNFGDLESCYATGEAQLIKPLNTAENNAASPPAVVVPGVEVQPLPQSFDDIMKAKPTTSSDDHVLPAQGTVSKPLNIAPRRSPAPQQNAWTAKSGEDMKAVLSRWSSAAGYDLQWQASDNGNVVQDITVNGSFEEAVSQLLAENRAVTGINGRFEKPVASPASTGAQWEASAGTNVQTVLEDWGRRANVTVVWQDYVSMPLKNNISQSGAFEVAVQSVLDQFANDPQRPVGQLNTDPVSGKRTLLVNLDKTP